MGRQGDKIHRRNRIIRFFNKQFGQCHYCGTDMTLDLGYRNTATIDHVIPRKRGGPTKDWNIVAACYTCNQAKGSKPYKAFMATFGQAA